MLAAATCLAGCDGGASPTEDVSDSAPSPAASAAAAGDTFEDRVDAITEAAKANADAGIVPGLTVALADHDETATLAFGVSDLGAGTPMRPDDRFRIASITKSMTATIVLQLVEEGKLGLDDTVETWLPGVLDAGDRITLRDLLGHVSGLPEADDSRYVRGHRVRHGVTDQEYVRLVAQAPLEAEPGELFVYRNINFVLLGMVVEAVTGQDIGAVMRERLFEPLGLRDTRLATEGHPGPRLVRVYDGLEDLTWLDVYWAGAAGGVTSTADDLATFYRALFSGELLDDERLAEMTDIRDDDVAGWNGYGLGLAAVETDCGTALGHSGRLPGLATEAWSMPERGRSVVVLVNGDGRLAGGTIDVVREAALCG
ncbi:serine hydrolase domain-containing protein [Nocardioides iriomotensis]|uniref:serine hydrolase domain-containing protein n=1 Tax=Nocardioides iriomotensis TaxID=715784 RepID=UPI0013EA7F19|nr:serine hydrolase domain-containing protein [Nocardioides iriomotensis]